MIKKPTYSAIEVRRMCLSMDLDYEAFKTLQEMIEEEFELYQPEDLPVLMQASMIMFSRSLLKLSLKNLK